MGFVVRCKEPGCSISRGAALTNCIIAIQLVDTPLSLVDTCCRKLLLIVKLLRAGTQGSSSTSYTAPRLTYPQDPQDAAGGLHAEESESDILPFAIDGDTAAFDATSSAADGKSGAPGMVLLQLVITRLTTVYWRTTFAYGRQHAESVYIHGTDNASPSATEQCVVPVPGCMLTLLKNRTFLSAAC